MKADTATVTRLLKTARGQIDGVLAMIEEDRYCMDISTQLLAISAEIKRANREVLTAHLKSCVREAESEEERDQKVGEVVSFLEKVMK